MSNFLAIATVTATLRQILHDAVRQDVTGGGEVHVTHVRPGGDAPQTPTTGVNIFMYGVSLAAALRNEELPTRRPDGSVAAKPQAALDLHYLLTFYGDDAALETQRLMGSVVRTLHSDPVLSRQQIKEVVAATAALTGSDLEDAVQAVRFGPLPLTLEELSKLWSILFQTPYALSVAYQATAVLVEGTETPAPGLPVRRRTVLAVPLAVPRVDAVSGANDPAAPITASSTLVLAGDHLRGDRTRVRIRDRLVEPATVARRQITVDLAPLPVRAGVTGVQVVHDRLLGDPPTLHRGEESSTASFVLAPELTAVRLVAGPSRAVEADVTPPVRRGQHATLLLTALGVDPPVAFRLPAPRAAADAPTVAFPLDPDLPDGTYLARVQVDGAESPLTTDADGAYDGPAVVIA